MRLKHLFLLTILFLFIPLSVWAKFTVRASGINYEQGTSTDFPDLDTIVVFGKITTGGEPKVIFTYNGKDLFNYSWYKSTSSGETFLGSRSSVISDTLKVWQDGRGEGTYHIKVESVLLPEAVDVYFAVLNYENYPVITDELLVHDDGETPVSFDRCKWVYLEVVYQQNPIEIFSPVTGEMKAITPLKKFVWSWDDGEVTGTENFTSTSAVFEPSTYKCIIYDSFFSSDAVRFANPESSVAYDAPIAVTNPDNTINKIAYTVNERSGNNESNKGSVNGNGNLQGSAPLDVSFVIDEPSSAIVAKEWSVFRGEDTNRVALDYADDFRYVFRTPLSNSESSAADYMVYLTVSSDYCSVTDSLGIKLVVSSLAAPNLFVIGFGSTYDYRVSYQSLKAGSFEGNIYHRWGRRVFHWTDPSKGWDGRRAGTGGYVSPGAYVVVVRAVGVDGIRYDIRHSLTIVREK